MFNTIYYVGKYVIGINIFAAAGVNTAVTYWITFTLQNQYLAAKYSSTILILIYCTLFKELAIRIKAK